MQPKISIALTTYNGARFLGEQLASLAAQTYRPHELVVCDDGSKDATLEIVEAFAKTAPFPVRLVRNEKNLGYADNFLKAASLCEGEWVAFCDQDDVWLADKLETVAAEAVKNPSLLLIAHPATLVDTNLQPIGKVAWPSPDTVYGRLQLPPWRSGMGCGQVFRAWLVHDIPWTRRFLDDVDPPRVAAHDSWIVKLSQCLGPARYLERPLILRRRHESAATIDLELPTDINRRRSLRLDVGAELERLSALARDRVEVLTALAEATAPHIAAELKDAAQYFEAAAKVLERRAAWRRRGGLGRVVGAAGLFTSPAYWRMGEGIVGWKGMVRDLFDLPRGAR